jgi:inhibitor of KinA sporulation pathway (predicted exonuclease)
MIQATNFSSGTSIGWKQLYECAILELDHTKLSERITDARRAILDRAEEVLTRPSTDEHRALNDALRTLRILEQVTAREKSAA